MIESKHTDNESWPPVSPGEIILDAIEERNWSQKNLADRLGVSAKHVSQLINAKVPVTPAIAQKLSFVLGPTAGFWLRLEAHYQEQLLDLELSANSESHLAWLEQFPLADLKKARIIPNLRTTRANKLRFFEELLIFFGVGSPKQWEDNYVKMRAKFRKAKQEKSHIGALTAWLRMGEIDMEVVERDYLYEVDEIPFNAARFKKELREVRKLTVLPSAEFQNELVQRFLSAGVHLFFVPAIPKAHVSGVARWISNRPIVQLSLYGKTNDKFWFTLYHESAHILLHSKDKGYIYMDDEKFAGTDMQQEMEANAWAENMLIPDQYKDDLPNLVSATAIEDFAKSIGIHPGIVVGRLQKERLVSYNTMNQLKEKVSFEDVLLEEKPDRLYSGKFFLMR